MTLFADQQLLVQAGLFSGWLGCLLLLEHWFAWRNAPLHRWRVRLRNLLLGGSGALLGGLLAPLASVQVAAWTSAHQFGLANLAHFQGLGSSLAGYLALDLAIYAQHRASHRWRWFWRLHATHHSESHLDATTAVRFHPLEIGVSLIWKAATIAIIGVPVAAVIAFEVGLSIAVLFNHSNLALPARLAHVLGWLLVSPDMHRVHHSVQRHEADTNFGFCLPWWDHLFGTYSRSAGNQDPSLRIGFPGGDGPATGSLTALLLLPLRIRRPNDRVA
ncbi:MAG: sterol desaturase family protein [Steroidobacteraceae bacterium]